MAGPRPVVEIATALPRRTSSLPARTSCGLSRLASCNQSLVYIANQTQSRSLPPWLQENLFLEAHKQPWDERRKTHRRAACVLPHPGWSGTFVHAAVLPDDEDTHAHNSRETGVREARTLRVEHLMVCLTADIHSQPYLFLTSGCRKPPTGEDLSPLTSYPLTARESSPASLGLRTDRTPFRNLLHIWPFLAFAGKPVCTPFPHHTNRCL
jgi:hypothetical protein